VAQAIASGARRAGWTCRELPLADGGEGTLEALGGANRHSRVSGPLGAAVESPWRLTDGRAVIEAALASGLSLVGGATGNDPLLASSAGTGELIASALDLGTQSIVVGVGGSASTDGGLGAVEALRERAPFPVPVRVACDVQTPFLEAASVFAPQKGATAAQVSTLTARLERLAARYDHEFGVDVCSLAGAGAAGGLAGGLAALGATLVPGFDLVATEVGLDDALLGVDLIVTGEGRLDSTSFDGKVVGEIVDRARRRGIDVLIVAGDIDRPALGLPSAVSLVERFGREQAWATTEDCIARAVEEALTARPQQR
jgi:glycerate kinase